MGADRRRPNLGVYLGHQLLADALGGAVASRPEIGIRRVHLTRFGWEDPLSGSLPAILDMFLWHGAEVTRPPNSAALLASDEACRIQAMRW